MKVAILGTGAMGGAMARTLAAAGFELALFNRTRARAEQVAAGIGDAATVVDTPAAAVADAAVVITSLSHRDAVTEVLTGPDGAIDALADDAVVAEMSTVEPDVVRGLASDVRQRGADIIDAPVSGSVSTVEAAALTIMVGGSASSLEIARPVLEALSKRIFHMGTLGTGATMKLAVNTIVHGLNQALAEALVLAEKGGIDRSLAYDVIASSAVAAPFVDYKRDAYEHPDEADVAFRIVLVHKDLELILSLADQLGVPMTQAAANRTVAQAAIDRGLGERDLSALAVHLRADLQT